MRSPSIDDSLRVLGLHPSAGAAEITIAFRRLAKLYHPDLNPSESAHRRFAEVVRAYNVLKERFTGPDLSHWAPCPHCGRIADLLDSLDGQRACAECLLGMTHRRRCLPLPVYVVARHPVVFMFYATGLALLVHHLSTYRAASLWLSLASTVGGLLVLAVQVLFIARRTGRSLGTARIAKPSVPTQPQVRTRGCRFCFCRVRVRVARSGPGHAVLRDTTASRRRDRAAQAAVVSAQQTSEG